MGGFGVEQGLKYITGDFSVQLLSSLNILCNTKSLDNNIQYKTNCDCNAICRSDIVRTFSTAEFFRRYLIKLGGNHYLGSTARMVFAMCDDIRLV